MTRWAMAAALSLSACSAAPTPIENQSSVANETAASEGTRAAFPISGDDLMVGIVGLKRPWNGKPNHQTSARDDLTGGTSTMLIYPAGAINIFTLPDGKVWRVRLVAGQGDRCGSAADLSKGVEAVDQMLQAKPSRVNLTDGCTRIATITA